MLSPSIHLGLLKAHFSQQIARRAAYEALGETTERIDKHIAEYPDVEGIVLGDESRLRQIITNLARSVVHELSIVTASRKRLVQQCM